LSYPTHGDYWIYAEMSDKLLATFEGSIMTEEPSDQPVASWLESIEAKLGKYPNSVSILSGLLPALAPLVLACLVALAVRLYDVLPYISAFILPVFLLVVAIVYYRVLTTCSKDYFPPAGVLTTALMYALASTGIALVILGWSVIERQADIMSKVFIPATDDRTQDTNKDVPKPAETPLRVKTFGEVFALFAICTLAATLWAIVAERVTLQRNRYVMHRMSKALAGVAAAQPQQPPQST
jgi:4-amino-4-deoxy-L-arabinose transferase-like glycosyltransferase